MTKKVDLRIEDYILDTIDQYAALHDINRSKAIRELLRNGLTNRATMDLQEQWSKMMGEKWLSMKNKTRQSINEGKSLIFVRDGYKCQKCHSTEYLQVYPIDRDPLNKDPTNLITLCKDCANRAMKFTPKRRVIEDFLEWFYLL